MQRRIIAALPIAMVVALLLGVGSAGAALPVKKSLFYTGPLLHLSANKGIPSSSAATSFTVPSLSCSTTDPTTGITLGSGIYSADSNWVSAGGVVAECQSGVPVYSAQVIVDNNVSDLTVTPAAGDAMSTAVDIAPGQTQVTVDDVTQNSSTTMTVPGGSVATYLLLGADVDRNPAVAGVPNFGKVKFTNASFNGRAVGDSTKAKIADLYSSQKVLEVSASQLTHKGTGFSLKFVNSGVSGTP